MADKTFQVLCGFFITACIVFIFSIFKSILDHLISVYQEPSSQLSRWSLALRNTIISFADQQVVTGISVIIGGIFQIHKGISAYHWEFVVNLAWFSAVTHLITLAALRDDIHNQRIRSTTTWLRILGMAVLLVLLMFAMYPMGYLLADNSIPARFPTWCLYHPEFEWKYELLCSMKSDKPGINYPISSERDYNWLYVTLAYIALLYSFTTRVIFLQKGKWNFKSPHISIHTLNPVSILEGWMSKLKIGKLSVFKVMTYKILRTNHALLVSSVDLYQSTLWEVSATTFVPPITDSPV